MNKLIYIADDEKSIRELMKTYLLNAGYDVKDFESGDDLLMYFLEYPADLIVLDIMMNGSDGLTICKKIRQNSDVPIILVSAKGDEFDRIAGINIGADDYLCKPFSIGELTARINRILTRIEKNKNMLKDCIFFDDLVVNPNTHQITFNNQQVELTMMEYNFLEYLVTHKQRAVSRNELLREVWQINSDVNTRAIDDLIKRLRKKINACDSVVEIQTIRGFGYVLSSKLGDEVK